MKKHLIILLLSSLTIALSGQNLTYLGLEGGMSFDKYEFFDNGDQLLKVPLHSWSAGMTLSHDLGKYFSLETGLFLKEYQKGYAFAIIGGEIGITSLSNSTMQIPLRIRSRIPLIKDKLFFTPLIGYHICFNKISNTGTVEFRALGSGPHMESHEDFNGNVVNNFGLLETAIGLELQVFKSSRLTFSAGYFTGFKKVTQGDITYTIEDGPETRATVYSKGDYGSLSLGLRVPLNRFWPMNKTKSE